MKAIRNSEFLYETSFDNSEFLYETSFDNLTQLASWSKNLLFKSYDTIFAYMQAGNRNVTEGLHARYISSKSCKCLSLHDSKSTVSVVKSKTAQLGPKLNQVGPLWRQPGPSWAQPGPILGAHRNRWKLAFSHCYFCPFQALTGVRARPCCAHCACLGPASASDDCTHD